MPKFIVETAEIFNCYYEIDADSEEEAISKIAEGDGLEIESDRQYVDYASDPEYWNAWIK